MSLFDLIVSEDEEERRARRINGVTVGVVTSNKDPSGLGRVKVHFPWMSDDNESNWLRVATFLSGSERGSYFIPEVEDAVLVAYIHGDINQPVVIGSLWSKEDKPPESNQDGENNIKILKTRSGHEIKFDDKKQQESISIKSMSGHQILLSDDSNDNKVLIKTMSGHEILLEDTSGSEKIRLKDNSGSLIELTPLQGKLVIKAAIIEIEATSMMTVKSNGNLVLRGSIVSIN